MYESFNYELAQAYWAYGLEDILHFDEPVKMIIEEEPCKVPSDDEAERFVSDVLAF